MIEVITTVVIWFVSYFVGLAALAIAAYVIAFCFARGQYDALMRVHENRSKPQGA